MKLPHEDTEKTFKRSGAVRPAHRPSKVPLVISIVALSISAVSMAFAGYLYATQPQRINGYVQAHRQELKGDKGDSGPMGPRGFTGASGLNGTNSYAPTHCSTYGFGDYASTNCY